MQKKDIVLWVILSLITCGIASIIWFIQLTDDVGKLSGDSEFTGVKYFLLTLITCGIFGFYWAYKVGKELDVAAEKHGKQPKNNAILYLLLQVCQLGIVNYIIIQDELNEYAD